MAPAATPVPIFEESSDIYYSYTGNRRNGFSYDAAGNLTNDLGQNFTYDVTGQQTNASYSGYSLVQSYDGDGLRVKKNDNREHGGYTEKLKLRHSQKLSSVLI